MQPRKKSKPNPKEPTADASTPGEGRTPSVELLDGSSTAKTAASEQEQPQMAPLKNSDQGVAGDSSAGGHQANRTDRKSWYNGGSWRAKASPVAEVARQSASGIGSATLKGVSERHRRQSTSPSTPKGPPAAGSRPSYLSQAVRQPSRSGPLPASMTILNVTANSSDEQREALTSQPPSIGKVVPDPSSTIEPEAPEIRAEAGKDCTSFSPTDNVPKEPSQREQPPTGEEPGKRQEENLGWRTWWFKAGADNADSEQDTAKTKAIPASQADVPLPASSTVKVPVRQTEQEPPQDIMAPVDHTGTVDALAKHVEDSAQAHPKPELLLDGQPATQERARSWLGLWGGSQSVNPPVKKPDTAVSQPMPLDVQTTGLRGAVTASEATKPLDAQKSKEPQARVIAEPNKHPMPPSDAPEPSPQQPGTRSSGWGLWSKGAPIATPVSSSNPPKSELKAVAVSDTPSATKREPAKVEQSKEAEKLDSVESNKRGRPISVDSRDDPSVTVPPAVRSELKTTKPSPASIPGPGAGKSNTEAAGAKRLQKFKSNLILPTFRETYQRDRKPSLWQQLSRYLYGAIPAERHLHISASPPRIRKAIAIGVHGYFPVAMIQKILGQPTGTSIRFADGAAAAIKRWTNQHGYDCEVERIPLEGEGTVSDRVDILWKSLLNWVEKIRQADFILIACHSQGVPVAIMLIARLIMFGCVSQAKIGVCAMAGVNLGPFPEYKSRYFGGAAAELFEFSSPASKVSHKYMEALNIALKHGVRIVYIGSIDDQLVSLESATFANVSHPYFYRAVFIDGRIHAPSFLTHLVGFALKLRNLGISDHGLIRELSSSLAGSLYSGEGHSTIYNDPAVFDLAVTHALETTDVSDVPLNVKKYEVPAQANPYFLPWAMRGVIEEEYVRRELQEEMRVLLEEFDDWKPTTKALKDVKFRLEAVKSKL